jgi:hypothetical protein
VGTQVGREAPIVVRIWEPHWRSLLLLRWCLLCLLFGAVGCIVVLVVILESHPRRLPLSSVFDRIKVDSILEIISASLYGVTGVMVKKRRRPFQKPNNGSVSPVAFIPEVHHFIFERRLRLNSSDGKSLPVATMLLSNDEHR